MAAQKGVTLVIMKGDGGSPEAFTKIAGIRSKSITQNATQIDVTTDDDVNLSGLTTQVYLPGILNFSVSGSGIAKDKDAFNTLQADFNAGTVANYRVVNGEAGVWEGAMFIQSLAVNGEVDGARTLELNLMANGAVDYTPTTTAPANALAPSVSGVAQVDETLTVIEGIWTGGSITYTYQWQTDSGGGFADISGATSRTYTPIAGQIGQPLRCVVTATNSAGSASANSADTADVIAA